MIELPQSLHIAIPVLLLFGILFSLMAARDLNKGKRCFALSLGLLATVFLLMGLLCLNLELVVLEVHNHHTTARFGCYRFSRQASNPASSLSVCVSLSAWEHSTVGYCSNGD